MTPTLFLVWLGGFWSAGMFCMVCVLAGGGLRDPEVACRVPPLRLVCFILLWPIAFISTLVDDGDG